MHVRHLVGQQVVEDLGHLLLPALHQHLAAVRVAPHRPLLARAVEERQAAQQVVGVDRPEIGEADRVVAPAAAELGLHQRVVHAGVAQLVPGLARHVHVEVPGHLRVLVHVAGHQLGRRQLGVHQAVEKVALLLGLDRHVVLVAVHVELVREIGVAIRGHSTNESRTGSGSGAITVSSRVSLSRIGSAPRSSIDTRRSPTPSSSMCRSWRSSSWRSSPLGRLVGDRVEHVEVALHRAGQRGLQLTVGQRHVVAGRGGSRHPIEQGPEVVAGRAGIVAGVAQLVEAALDLRHAARVVVEMVAQRVFALPAGLKRQPAGGQVHQLSQRVEVVGEADRVLVDVVAQLQRLMGCHAPSLPPPTRPRRAGVACDGPPRSAGGPRRRRR